MQPKNHATVTNIEADNRGLDPIVTTAEYYDDSQLAENALYDIRRVDSILAEDRSLTGREKNELYYLGCNLRLDWLYARHGGQGANMVEFSAHWDEAEEFFGHAAQQAAVQRERNPNDYWDVSMKQLDLRALQSQRNAKESQTTLRGTEAGKAGWLLADNQLKSVLVDSTRLLSELQRHAEGDSNVAQDARGKLYELALITYARLKLYQDETFDTTFVRSALDREDRPWNNHAYQKHGVDIVIDAPGQSRLLQAKNHYSNQVYASPIEVIEDRNFTKTLEDMPKFISEFRLLLANPSNPSMRPALDYATKHLDSAFGAQLQERVDARY